MTADRPTTEPRLPWNVWNEVPHPDGMTIMDPDGFRFGKPTVVTWDEFLTARGYCTLIGRSEAAQGAAPRHQHGWGEICDLDCPAWQGAAPRVVVCSHCGHEWPLSERAAPRAEGLDVAWLAAMTEDRLVPYYGPLGEPNPETHMRRCIACGRTSKIVPVTDSADVKHEPDCAVLALLNDLILSRPSGERVGGPSDE